jgi:ankyrin repeat protein
MITELQLFINGIFFSAKKKFFLILFLRSFSSETRQNPTGHTLLHLAVISKASALVSFLIEHGAELNAVDWNGFTPLHFAAWLGLPHIVRTLLHGIFKIELYLFIYMKLEIMK